LPPTAAIGLPMHLTKKTFNGPSAGWLCAGFCAIDAAVRFASAGK
jgi:hypothetical protein